MLALLTTIAYVLAGYGTCFLVELINLPMWLRVPTMFISMCAWLVLWIYTLNKMDRDGW